MMHSSMESIKRQIHRIMAGSRVKYMLLQIYIEHHISIVFDVEYLI